MTAATLNEVGPQILRLYPRIDAILAEMAILAQIELRYKGSAVGDVKVAVFIAIINAPVAAVHLRTFRHADKQYDILPHLD